MTFLLTLITVAAGGPTPGDHDRKLTVDGRERRYLVHVPPSYDGSKPTPVVLIYHGGGGNPESMVRFCGMNRKADGAGFLAVYPAGTGFAGRLTFNGGECCGYAQRRQVDDVAFTRAALDDLAEWANVDAKRVYATGMSNGGIVTYCVAAKLADRIAAVAPVGGPMMTATCDPKRPVSVMHFHGTADRFAPLAGGKGRGVSGMKFRSVAHSIKQWVKANGCDTTPAVKKLPVKVDDGTSAVRKTYGNGKDGSEVVLIQIKGGGHTWPGGPARATFLGKTTRNVSANDLMWEFFQKHPME